MTTLREVVRRLFAQPAPAVSPDDQRDERVAARDRVNYSYTVFWMKHARTWDAGRRRAVLDRARSLTLSGDFARNSFERRYRVEGVEGDHSGASVVALVHVLEALDAAG
jgi:hypothetical protein